MGNTYAHLAGYKRLARELLEMRRDRPSRPIRSRTVTGFPSAEADDLAAALGPKHYRRQGDGSIRIHVSRIVRDDFEGDETAFWSALEEAAGSPRVRPPAPVSPLGSLLAYVGSLSESPARDFLLGRLRGSGWPARVARNEGLAEAKAQVEIFVRAVDAVVPPPAEPVTLQILASQLFRDSHALDPWDAAYRQLTDFLAGLPEADIDTRDPRWRRTVLEQHNVFQSRLEMTVYVAGNVDIIFPDGPDDRVRRNTARGLPTCLTIDEIELVSGLVPAPQVTLCSENAPPFTEMVKRVPEGMLLACTMGWSSVPTLSRLLSVVSALGSSVYHWGDTDIGGFRILAALRRRVPVRPFLMDRGAVRKHPLQPFDHNEEARKKRKHIESQMVRLDPAAQHTLHACLELGGWLEQEAVPLADALRALLEAKPSPGLRPS